MRSTGNRTPLTLHPAPDYPFTVKNKNSNYDSPPNRRGTGSIKWDRPPCPGAPEQLPLWVADMDFPAPQPVIEAIQRRGQHGIFGYTEAGPSYYRALDHWFSHRFGLSVEAESVTITPGIVPAIGCAIRAFSEPGEGVIIQNPVYYPFASAVRENGRSLLVNNLLEEEGRYRINFEELEAIASRPEARLLILCSPHNPVGRVWSREELERVADIAGRHSLLVISDEIHCDLVMPDAPRPHTPYPLTGSAAATHSILCTAPSKTFNIPGLATSNIIITERDLRRRFRKEVNRSCSDLPNCFGVVACEAAYLQGGQWLEETLAYIQANRDHLSAFLARELPEVTISPLEATYLPWLDLRPVCRRLSTDSASLERLLIDKAGVWLEAGSIFGSSGEGFLRMNIACSRALLAQALEQVATVLKA
jgi:cysteine-S-conjugate beta-lyase